MANLYYSSNKWFWQKSIFILLLLIILFLLTLIINKILVLCSLLNYSIYIFLDPTFLNQFNVKLFNINTEKLISTNIEYWLTFCKDKNIYSDVKLIPDLLYSSLNKNINELQHTINSTKAWTWFFFIDKIAKEFCGTWAWNFIALHVLCYEVNIVFYIY